MSPRTPDGQVSFPIFFNQIEAWIYALLINKAEGNDNAVVVPLSSAAPTIKESLDSDGSTGITVPKLVTLSVGFLHNTDNELILNKDKRPSPAQMVLESRDIKWIIRGGKRPDKSIWTSVVNAVEAGQMGDLMIDEDIVGALKSNELDSDAARKKAKGFLEKTTFVNDSAVFGPQRVHPYHVSIMSMS